METTTIQIRKTLKKGLDKLKVFPGESMDSVIERLTRMNFDEEPLSKEDIKGIEEGLADIKEGRVYTTKQVKKELGIK